MSGRMKALMQLAALAMAIALAGSAAADIIDSTGAVVQDTIPLSLDLNQWESSDSIYVFAEQQNLKLLADLAVDITQSGTYSYTTDLTPGTIAANTLVNSYLIHVDPLGDSTKLITYGDSTITFSNPILGVIVQTSSLNDTDGSLGVSTTAYYEGQNRGLELNGQDTITLSVSPYSISLSLKAAEVIDNIRVIEAVPVPAAVLLGMLGLTAAGLKLRKYV